MRDLRDWLLEQARAPKTVALYRQKWARYEAWCRSRRLVPYPSEAGQVVDYISEEIRRGIAAGSCVHTLAALCAGYRDRGRRISEEREIRQLSAGLRRVAGRAEARRAEPLLHEQVVALAPVLPARERAILLIGWWGALRAGEIGQLRGRDVCVRGDAVILRIARSKCDQEGKGCYLELPACGGPACPVAGTGEYHASVADLTGRYFRGPRGGTMRGEDVSRLVHGWAHLRGLTGWYSGHSLRAGLATELFRRGVPEREIMRQTRHRSREVLRLYIRGDAEGSPLRGYFSDAGSAGLRPASR